MDHDLSPKQRWSNWEEINMQITPWVINLKFAHVIVNKKFTKAKDTCHGKPGVYLLNIYWRNKRFNS